MNLNDFNGVFKEHYTNPMNEFYRDRYRRMYQEEPPEDMKLVMDLMIKSGEEDIIKIIKSAPTE